jgi:hypothetical protein
MVATWAKAIVRRRTERKADACDITAAAMYPHQISARVKELRAEIETLTEANLLSLKRENPYTQEADRQRRAERLREILDELKALTECVPQAHSPEDL